MGPKRILIIDDSVTVREGTKRILEGAGYTVRAVPDSVHANGAMAEDSYQLLLIDVNLNPIGVDGKASGPKKMDGPEVLKLYRRAFKGVNQPKLVLYSGKERLELFRIASQCQADGIICKDVDDLLLSVRRFVGEP